MWAVVSGEPAGTPGGSNSRKLGHAQHDRLYCIVSERVRHAAGDQRRYFKAVCERGGVRCRGPRYNEGQGPRDAGGMEHRDGRP